MNTVGFGMRLQMICREGERDAWEAADILVRDASERQKLKIKTLWRSSNFRSRPIIDGGLKQPRHC